MRRITLLLLLLSPLAAVADDDPALLGVGLRTRPAYDGSRSQVTDVIPIVSWYGKSLFVRSTQGVLEGGARMSLGSGFTLGAQAAYEAGPRSEETTGSLGVHAEWEGKIGPAPVLALARLRERFAGEGGRQVDLRVTVGVYQRGAFSAGVYGQTVWTSAGWNQDYYRVHASGLNTWQLGLISGYDIGERWVVLGSVEAGRLSHVVAGSPYVQQRSTLYASLGLARKF